MIINKLENEFFRHNANKTNLVIESLNRENTKRQYFTSLFKEYMLERNKFVDCFNELFQQTNKELNIDKRIYIKSRDKLLTPYKLSSGEKQMLIILLQVYLQDGQDGVLVMDEPEISLHFEWQKRLIEIIRQINPNVQLIIATHSPYIAMNGWLDKVINIEDITSISE